MNRSSLKQDLIALSGIYVLLVFSHLTLLHVPYFWDEAGYYIPAAYDFFKLGILIPASTVSNAHPPLPAFYLALWWKLFGFKPIITRLAMLLVASFALLEVWKIARRFCDGMKQTNWIATSVVFLTVIYPGFFAQSSMAHADLPAAALTLCGIRLWMEEKRSYSSFAFALACLAKETAIVFPIALIFWEFTSLLVFKKKRLGDRSTLSSVFFRTLPLALSPVPLLVWYIYHFAATGHIFGNAEFFRYNIADTLSILRFFAAFTQRGWHLFGHMGLWVLTLAAVLAGFIWKIDKPKESTSPLIFFWFLIIFQWVFYSIAGGALLTRYLLVAYPLIILILLRTTALRTSHWKFTSLLVAASFLFGWWNSPPYRSAPEDNLSYRDFAVMHQGAIDYISGHYKDPSILTAWPASDELTRPWLGYLPANSPLALKAPRIIRVENFSVEQVLAARQNSDYNLALVFNTKDIPPRRIHVDWWDKLNQRYFRDHEDLSPESIAKLLGGKIMYREDGDRGWIAVIYMERLEVARLAVPGS
jgi:hypothetical protein